LALKVRAAVSLVAATRFQQVVSLLRSSAAQFYYKTSCCSKIHWESSSQDDAPRSSNSGRRERI
jgi:hypothetical protein